MGFGLPGDPVIGKTKVYRGLTRMSADREKAKPTTEALRHGEENLPLINTDDTDRRKLNHKGH
jgi:hypothetical protein